MGTTSRGAGTAFPKDMEIFFCALTFPRSSLASRGRLRSGRKNGVLALKSNATATVKKKKLFVRSDM